MEHEHEHTHDHCHGHCHEHAHGHSHEHSHGHSHAEEAGGFPWRILLSAVLLLAAYLLERSFPLKTWQLLLIYLVPYLVAGYATLREAVEHLLAGEALDENFLMSVATLGALCIGFLPGAAHQFPEAVFVMLFFQVGEWFEGIAEGRSRSSIAHLMDLRPDTVSVERNGGEAVVDPAQVAVGETVVIRPGERIALDGEVLDGVSSLDTVALTGESLPRDVAAGDEVVSGCVNRSGVLRVRVTRPLSESTASRILELVEDAAASKSRSEHFITRFARVYTPIVVAVAFLLAFVPPLLWGPFSTAFPVWLYRALTFLVVSCPCALVISVPLAFFCGIGKASRHGILVKGSQYLEALSRVGTVVFDKTGTLTEGVFEVTAIHPELMDGHQLLHLAAHVEQFSRHPIAESLRRAWTDGPDDCSVTDVQEIAGQGIRARVNGQEVCVGNTRLMEAIGAAWHPCSHAGTIVHVSVDGVYAGHVVVSDRVKSDAPAAVAALRKMGVGSLVMLTGDKEDTARAVARETGVDTFHAGLLPADKVNFVEEMLARKPQGKVLAFVGDGINDAPVLTRSDLGIAMGALGSDAAIEAADVVLMDDKPSKIAEGMRLARRTLRIARENTVFAIAVKVLVLVLAAFGLASMGWAVFADVGVTVLAVLNAMRQTV